MALPQKSFHIEKAILRPVTVQHKVLPNAAVKTTRATRSHKKKEEKVLWEKETWPVWFIVGFYVSIQYMYAVYTYRCKCCSYTHAPVVPKDPQSLWLTSRYFSSSFFSNFLSWGPWSYNPPKKWPYKGVTGVTTLLIGLMDHSRSPSLAGVVQGNDLALVLGNDRKSSCNCRSCRNTPYLSCGWKIFHLGGCNGLLDTQLGMFINEFDTCEVSRRQPETECNFQTSTISALPTGFQGIRTNHHNSLN